jgi:phosphohistidine phosphatase
MELVLMRHGIAEELADMRPTPAGIAATDHDRALTPLGRRRVDRAARGLVKLGFSASIIVHSGLVRAQQTAERVASVFEGASGGVELHVLAVECLAPDGEPEEFCRLLPQWKEAKSLLAVGHLPHLDRLVALLCGASGRLVTEMGKAAAIAFEVPTSGRPAGTLLWYLPPRMLRRFART